MVLRLVNRAAAVSSTIGLWVGAGLIVYMVVHINVEMILRNVFGRSTNSMGEFVGYAIGSMTYLAMAHTLAARKHVRVSLIRAVPSRRFALGVELFCLSATFAIFAFIGWYVWRILVRDFTRGSVSPTLMETPTWYIDAVILAGILMLLLQLVASAADAVAHGVPEDATDGD